MALTPMRWAALAIAGAFLALAYYFTFPDARPRLQYARDALVERERTASQMTSLVADKLRAAIIVDSVRKALGSARPDSMRIVFSGDVPRQLHPAFRTAALRAQSLTGADRMPIDVAVVLDTVSRVRGVDRRRSPWLLSDFVLPRGDERCLVVLRVRPPQAAPERRVPTLAAMAARVNEQRLFGPCAYVAAFGRPGPQVEQWLERGGWGLALSNAWTAESRSWRLPEWYWGGIESNDGWPLRSYISGDGLRCASGDREGCERALRDVRPAGRLASYPDMWGGRVVSTRETRDEPWYRLAFGPSQASLLSDMVHTIGRERFREFWTSTAPVPEAFEAASGRPLGDFAADWSRRHYGRYVARGPGMSGATVPIALAVMGLGALTAVLVVRRRQVV